MVPLILGNPHIIISSATSNHPNPEQTQEVGTPVQGLGFRVLWGAYRNWYGEGASRSVCERVSPPAPAC